MKVSSLFLIVVIVIFTAGCDSNPRNLLLTNSLSDIKKPTPTPISTPTSVTWEYLNLSYLLSGITPQGESQVLNQQGNAGWELIQVNSENIPIRGTTQTQIVRCYYFKRAKKH